MAFDRASVQAQFSAAMVAAGFGTPTFDARDDAAADAMVARGQMPTGSLISTVAIWTSKIAPMLLARAGRSDT